MKRIIVLGLLLILLATPGLVSAHSSLQIIEMTQDGFVPTEITVDENTSVLFINKDKEDRWPASNIHPTHEIYPEFDPKQPIKPGDSWIFKPKRTGEFKYHDHIKAHLRGVLTVTSEPGSTTASIVKQSDIRDWFEGLIERIKSLLPFLSTKVAPPKTVDLSGVEKLSVSAQSEQIKQSIASVGSQQTWGRIKELFALQAGSSGNIHDIAHLTGKLIFERDGFEGIKSCSSEFSFGCYHGFLDTAFSKSLDKLTEAQDACMKLSSDGGITGPAASCIHGIGHGVASFYSTNDLKKSLVSCRKLTMGAEYCYDGVFMEYVRSANDSFFKREDLLYPCNKLEEEFGYTYSFACGRNQPSLLMGRFKLGFNEVIQVCNGSTSTSFKQACFDSLGFSVAATGNSDEIISACRKIEQPELINRCLKAAAGELVFQEVPGWYESSQAICSSFKGNTKECFDHIDRLIREYSRQIKIDFPKKTSSEDTSQYIRTQLAKCYKDGGKGGCYKQLASVLYSQFGLSTTLQTLKNNENYPEVYARCHEVTHYLSRLEYEQQRSISKVYAQCDSTCHGGCYHGTMEAFLQEKLTESGEIASKFAKLCGSESDFGKPIEFNECLHGLGHAAMFVTEMDLPSSLKLCDSLGEQKYIDRCFSGVFMENSSSSTSADHASKYIKVDDPFYPCNSLEEKYQQVCWQYQSSYFSIISNQNWGKVADLCLQVPEKYQVMCFRTIGTNQVGFTQSPKEMKEGCGILPNEFKNVCVSGVISSLAYRFVGDLQKMVDFCSLVDYPNKESCFRQIGTSLLDWDKNKDVAKVECHKIVNPEGKNWCLSAT